MSTLASALPGRPDTGTGSGTAPAGAPAVGSNTAMNPRTKRLLHGAIVPTLLLLAWPNILVMTAQASTGLIETWWVSHLGTAALTGMAGSSHSTKAKGYSPRKRVPAQRGRPAPELG